MATFFVPTKEAPTNKILRSFQDELGRTSIDINLTKSEADILRTRSQLCQKIATVDDHLSTYRIILFPSDSQITMDFAVVRDIPAELPSFWLTIYSMDENFLTKVDLSTLASFGLTTELVIAVFEEMGLEVDLISEDELKFSEDPLPMLVEIKKQDHITIDKKILDDIFSEFPSIPSATKQNSEILDYQLKQHTYKYYLGKKIHPIALFLLKYELTKAVEHGIAPIYLPVGPITSDALASKMMQGALDRKHVGKEEVGTGANLLRETLRALKTIKYPEMTAHFLNRQIKPIEIRELILDYEAVYMEDIADVGLSLYESEKDREWLNISAILAGIRLPKIRDYLVIEINTQKMYNRGLTVEGIVAVLDEKLNKQRKEKLLHILPFPNYILDDEVIEFGTTRKDTWITTSIAIIPDPVQCYKEITDEKKAYVDKFRDFIEDPKANPPRVKEFTYTVFLVDIIQPTVKNMLLSGIVGINRVKIEMIRLAHYISKDQKIDDEKKRKEEESTEGEEEENSREKWRLFLDVRLMKFSFVDINDIIYLLKYLGCEILTKTESSIDVLAYRNFTGTSLKDDILRLYNDEISAYDKRDTERRRNEIERFNQYITDKENAVQKGLPMPEPIRVNYREEEPTPLMYANTVYYIKTDGSALLQLLARPEIDSNRIITNNMHELLVVFGIGVVRAVIMTMIATALGDNYIDPSYVMIIADVMTNRGKMRELTQRVSKNIR